MNNDNLVPETSGRFYGGHIRYGDIQLGRVLGNIGFDEYVAVWVERRLRSTFNSNDGLYITWLGRSYCPKPNEKCLAIGILRIELDAAVFGDECVNVCGETLTQWSPNPSAAGVSYGVQFCSSLFPGKLLHLFDRGRL